MYTPEHFAASADDAYDLIRHHPLGTLVYVHAGGLDANPIPWELELAASGPPRLIGHVARANPLCAQLPAGAQVLVVFQAEQGYISPNWYPSKQATHQQVPTWNYRVVHVHGRVQLHEDPKWALGTVGKLTRTQEHRAQAALPHPGGAWKIKDAPPDYLTAQLAKIVGVEITITRVEAKFKLSQNRSHTDRTSAAAQVSAASLPALGAHMRHAG